MDTLSVVLVLLAVALVAVAVWGAVSYNRLIRLRNLVQGAWRQIDVELHRRHTLVLDLVEAVARCAPREREVFAAVTDARARAAEGAAGPAQQGVQENALSSALSRLFAVAQDHPQLRTSPDFAELQAELTHTEDRIAAGRRFYNANVRELNTRVDSFPSRLVAAALSFRRAEYFEATDPTVRGVPTVGHEPRPGA